jgi:purine nucleoside permease
VADGDLGFEIDARETPADWPTGFIPLGKAHPYEEPATDIGGAVYHLDPGLVTWAYELTKNVKLEDTDTMRNARALYAGYRAAQGAPICCAAMMSAAQPFIAGLYSTNT